ncbi:MAG: RNA polymerase sigma factor [Desulfobacterales bacterium]
MARCDPAAGDDQDITQRVLEGEVDAFALLMERYQGYVLAIVKRHAPANQVEELAQEIFIKAFRSLAGWRRTGPFRSWLSVIAVRTCYDYWRKHYRYREIPMSSLSEAHREWLDRILSDVSVTSWEDVSRRREAREILDWGLNQLSAADRMVLELVYLEGESVKEAARLLGWSVANVKVRAFRARRKINKLLLQSGRMP